MRAFEHFKLKELDFDLESVTTDSGRIYKVPGGFEYSSITTVLSSYSKDSLNEWINRVGEEEANKKRRIAASRGTKLHDACEKYLKNELTPMHLSSMMPDVKNLFKNIRTALDKHIGVVYANEQPLYSHELKIAGRVDCIAEWDNKLSIIDFKTSEKEKQEEHIQNYFMQCSAYAVMYEEIVGKSIDNIVVLITTVESDIPQIFERQKSNYLIELKKYVNDYYKTSST